MEWTYFFSIIVLLGVVFAAAFYQLSVLTWTLLLGSVLILISLFSFLPVALLIVCWLIFLLAAGIANLTTLRQKYIIKPALKRLQKQMPSISATERAAIEAGDTWWEKELFCGRPSWKKLFEIPRPALTEEEVTFLNHQTEQACRMMDDWDIVFKDRTLSQQLWEYLKAEKFFALVIPKKYGGLGFSALAHSTIVTKLATRSMSAAVTTMVPNSLGPGELLLHYGTEEQKDFYLPRLARGDEIPCFALTAPDAGSDAGAIPDSGIITYGDFNGERILGIRLNWDKRYITLAPVATLLGLAIHLYDPEKLLGDNVDIGITLCLIPTSHPGVEIGKRHYPMYTAFMNGPTSGKNVFIPLDWIIGGERMAGQGWRMLMESLSIGRSISLPALSTACGKLAYQITGGYARIRKQFNTPISSFEGVEEALGYIAGFTYLLESCRLMTAGAVDQNINPAIVSAIAKYHMTELSRCVINHAMDVQAGQAVQVGPRNPIANIYLAIPISITVEGANILTRNLIIFGQGAIRCHPYLLKEIELITSKDQPVEALDKTLMSHVGFYISNMLRSFAYGLTGGVFIFPQTKNKKVNIYQKQLTRMSTALALLADTSLIMLGGSLKRRERISARLGDIMSYLYLASTSLKYFHDMGSPTSDEDYVCWTLQFCLFKIQEACDALFENFPVPFMGGLLRFIIFPFGKAYSPPSDKLHHKITQTMLTESELRDRLLQHTFQDSSPTNLGHRLEEALKQVTAIDPIAKKLQKAVKNKSITSYYDTEARLKAAREANILTEEEEKALNAYEHLRKEIIQVNEFSFDLSEVIK